MRGIARAVRGAQLVRCGHRQLRRMTEGEQLVDSVQDTDAKHCKHLAQNLPGMLYEDLVRQESPPHESWDEPPQS